MSECPYCGTAMEPGSIAQQPYEGCPGCGGVWIAAEALGTLVKKHPERLAELDDTWPDHGGKPSLDRLGVICPETGEELVKKAFPAAPQQPILASPKAKKLFFKSGELRTLHGTVSPTTLPPPPRPVAPVDERVERERRREEAAAELTATAWREAFSMKWPARGDGQSGPSWFVCGMPLWVAAVMLLLPALMLVVLLAQANAEMATPDVPDIQAGEEAVAEDPMEEDWSGEEEVVIPVWLGVPIVYMAWPVTTLALTLILLIVWALGGDGAPPLTFGMLFLLLLKVNAVVITGDALIGVIQLMHAPSMLVFVLHAVSRLIIYRAVMELDWRECYLLSFIGSFCGLSAL